METANTTTLQDGSSRKSVFLFKSPKENEPDKFLEVLKQANLSCTSIPVLSFRFVNLEELKSKLNVIHLFSAIIFTSVRAVEAVANLMQEMKDSISICNIQSFAVGHTTVEAARKIGFRPQGEDSGNARVLADFILQEVSSEDKRPLLYPCSNLHRDTLKEVLTSHGKCITEVISYETCPNEQMKDVLEEAIQHQGLPEFAVFFSPSGFQYTLDSVDKRLLPLHKLKIVALGPTTEKAVSDQGYSPFATAEKPDPQSLLQILLRYRNTDES